MNQLKKIIPIAALSVGGILLLIAILDVFMAAALFETLILRLSVILMLLLSLGVTVYACVEESLRRPLVLLACLLETPIGGGLAVLLIYEALFPGKLPLAALLPFIMLLAAMSTCIQAGVMLLCADIYREEEDEEDAPVALSPVSDSTAPDLSVPVAEESAVPAPVSEETPVSAMAAPAPAEPAPVSPAPLLTPVPAPVSAKPEIHTPAPVEITPEDEDDLAPIPRRKSKKQPTFENGMRNAVPVVPTVDAPAPKQAEQAPAAPAKEKPAKKGYTDPFGLLSQEVKPEESNSAKAIFGKDDSN